LIVAALTIVERQDVNLELIVQQNFASDCSKFFQQNLSDYWLSLFNQFVFESQSRVRERERHLVNSLLKKKKPSTSPILDPPEKNLFFNFKAFSKLGQKLSIWRGGIADWFLHKNLSLKVRKIRCIWWLESEISVQNFLFLFCETISSNWKTDVKHLSLHSDNIINCFFVVISEPN
jgi:hypothetical protein